MVPDQQLTAELRQFSQVASDLREQLFRYMDETAIKPTVFSSLKSAAVNAKVTANHLKAAAMLADADI